MTSDPAAGAGAPAPEAGSCGEAQSGVAQRETVNQVQAASLFYVRHCER